MTSLLELRPSPAPCPSWLADALPYSYDEAAKTQFRAMPGIQWVPKLDAPNGRGVWRGPRDAIEIVVATLEAAGVCKVRSVETPSEGIAFAELALDPRLRPYQTDGVAWLRYMLRATGGALLADEMGLGKTPQAIIALSSDAEPVLVVCPAVVAPHWEEEIYRWGTLPPGVTSKLWRVMSYEKFTAAVRKALGPRTADAPDAFPDGPGLGPYTRVVFDEIHYLSGRPPKPRAKAKPGESQRSGAARDWLAAQRPTGRPRVVGLSGTPMTTRPRDLWHPLDILWPGRFGAWFDFTRRYCNGHFAELTNDAGARITNADGEPLRPVWQSDGISRPEELRTRIAHCMLRRTKAQVGTELPPRTRSIVEVALPAAARKDLRIAMRALDLGGGARSAVGSLLAHSESYKLDAAEALARDVMAAGSRPLLLTTRRESAFELGRRLGCPSVTGDDDPVDRVAMLRDAPCGAATLYSVETGVNLTGFDVVIFVGLDWVPSRILQGEARVHRIGADKPVTIYFLIARGTVDEVIRERVIERLENFAAITGAAGDELGLVGDLAPESEEQLIAAIVAAVKGGSV